MIERPDILVKLEPNSYLIVGGKIWLVEQIRLHYKNGWLKLQQSDYQNERN